MSPDSADIRKFGGLSGFQLRAIFFIFALFGALAPALIWAQIQASSSEGKVLPVEGREQNAEPLSECRVGMRVYESDRGRQLLGEIIPGDLDRHLPGWSVERDTYEPAAEDMAVLSAVSEPVEIICVLGTWCGDSEREVPRFWRILEEVENPNLVLTHFAVGRSADDIARGKMVEIGFDENLRDVYNVDLVPTFIFYRGDRELGRIIETPEGTLEQDTAEILKAEFGSPGEPKGSSWH